MTTEPDNIVLEYLRAIRAGVDRLEHGQTELKQRVGSVELQLPHIHNDLAHHSLRMDHLGERIGRIEQRLGLIDA